MGQEQNPAAGPRFAAKSINPDNLHVMIDPVRREINPSAVAAQFHFLLDHFFPENLELHLTFVGHRRGGIDTLFDLLLLGH